MLLRRIKDDVDLAIPPKQEIILYAPMTSVQKEVQKDILDKSIVVRTTKCTELGKRVGLAIFVGGTTMAAQLGFNAHTIVGGTLLLGLGRVLYRFLPAR